MLKGISPLLSPELLQVLCGMGHGDELLLADAHFPAHSLNPRVLRADGLEIHRLLSAMVPLFELDSYGPPLYMMAAVSGDSLDPAVEARYLKALETGLPPNFSGIKRVERFAFYQQAKGAFAVVITGELAKYGNIILKKGVTPV